MAYLCECDDDFLIGMRLDEVDETGRSHWQAYLARLEAQKAERAP